MKSKAINKSSSRPFRAKSLFSYLARTVAKRIEIFVFSTFIFCIIEVFCIKYNVGIKILSIATSDIIANISYSYIAAYIFYFLIEKIPKLKNNSSNIKLSYYYVLIIINNLNSIIRELSIKEIATEENFKNLDRNKIHFITIFINNIEQQRNSLRFYNSILDPKTMLRIEEIVIKSKWLLLNDDFVIEGGNEKSNADTMNIIIAHKRRIEIDEDKNLKIAEKRMKEVLFL